MTGLPAKYKDKTSGMRYCRQQQFYKIGKMQNSIKEEYLQIRKAVSVLK